MKRIFYLILLFAGFQQASASHLMGGQITAQNIGGLSYKVTLTLYRDTLGIPMYTTATLNYTDTLSGFVLSHTVPVSPVTIYGNGVEMYTYTDTVVFPVSGQYTIDYTDCCRNAAILNMTQPGSENLYLRNILWADSSNSSPEFLNPPIPLAQLNQPFFYNPLPFDADGDSLEWVLDIPLGYATLPVLGYVLPSSDTALPFTLNSQNGEISFQPNTLGYFQASVLVREYRNGLLIGEIRRDMQIIVVNSGNNRAMLTNSSSNNFPYSGLNYDILPGSNFTLNLTIIDPDNQNMLLSAQGEAFLGGNAPTFAYSQGGGVATAQYNWSPTLLQARTSPYLSVVRISEYFAPYTFTQDLTLSLRIGNFTGLFDVSQPVSALTVFPNPASTQVNLEYKSAENTSAELQVLMINGQLALPAGSVELIQGVNLVQMNTSRLTQGMYIIQLVSGNQIIARERLTIQ